MNKYPLMFVYGGGSSERSGNSTVNQYLHVPRRIIMDWEVCQAQVQGQGGQLPVGEGTSTSDILNVVSGGLMEHPFPPTSQQQPYMEMLVQPQGKFRFRYKSEMTGKHGSLLGVLKSGGGGSSTRTSSPTGSTVSSAAGIGGMMMMGGGLSEFGEMGAVVPGPSSSSGIPAKLFPTVKLHNFTGEAVIRISLVCDGRPHYPHPHLLEMTQPHHDISSGSSGGGGGVGTLGESFPCYVEVPVSADNDYTAVFQGLNIIFVGKKESRRVLQYKMSQVEDPQRRVTQGQLDDLALTINPNVVSLYFEAFTKYPHPGLIQICKPIISSPVQHNKSTQTGELKIVRIDKTSSCCTGGEEVFILVEKVDKHNIQIKFYEESEKGVEIWKAYGKFSKLDVHHQYAIVFKTPPYRTFDIGSEVNVWLQLERPSDGQTSLPIPFKYRPLENTTTPISRKMPKRQGRTRNEEGEGGDPSSTFGGSSTGGTHTTTHASSGGGASMNLPGSSSSNLRQQGASSTLSSSFAKYSFAAMASTSEQDKDTTSKSSSSSSKALAMNVALSICRGIHEWTETSDFSFVLQKVRHLLCLVNENGDNSLHSAIIHQQKEPFLHILETLASFPDTSSVINEPNFHSLTPLHLAVLSNRMDFVLELLRHNADSSLQNSEGDTPLHIAVKMNNVPCVKYLLQTASAQAALNKFNYASMSPLLLAIAQGSTELVEIFCGVEGISLTAQEGTYGRTPLHMAVEKETKESIISTMIILKNSGVKGDLTNIQNYAGNTPLHIAASAGYTTLCALLMHYGADPLIENHVRKETDNEEEDESPTTSTPSTAEEDGPQGQTVFDMVTSEKVLRVLKGTVDDWEIILKAVSPLLLSTSSSSSHSMDNIASPKDKDFDHHRLDVDSGLDADTFNSSQYLSSSSSNQLS